jgi:hypothetical protein
MSGTGRVDVTVTELGRVVRRRLGPVAWAVLEELVARGASQFANDGAVDARMDTVAEELGISAPRVRAAVSRLSDLGIVEREQSRTPGTHRFASTRYRIVGRTGLVVTPGERFPEDENPSAGSPPAVRRDPDADGIDQGLPSTARAGVMASELRPPRAATRPIPALSVSPAGAANSSPDRPAVSRRRNRPTGPSPQLSLLDPCSRDIGEATPDTSEPGP